MIDILDELNESQRAAVAYNDGPSLVIAGAGSGKTRVLTYKIAYLLQQGIPANRILALTFTNKAAREMKERIMRLVGQDTARYLWMGTFHSIASKILRQEAEHLGYTRDFSIYDSADSKSVIKQVCKEMQLDDKVYKTNMVASRISAAKNALVTAEMYAQNRNYMQQDKFDRLYEMAEIYRRYELRLKSANAMDFDDLLLNLCYLLQKDEGVLHYYQGFFQQVLVDEYQDTNYAQYLLVKMLAEPENRVCVVGDDAQSIYSFRGADIRNILSFQQGYPNAKLFKLERNYRSTQTIVKAANSLIHHNENQIYKEVYSEKEAGDKIRVTSFMSDREEAQGVAESIHYQRQYGYNNIAILYRTNAQSRTFENEMRRLNIPYRIYGGTSFYQRKEIKDAICYFRLASNTKDNEALQRVINFPARGIGDTTLRKVSDCAYEQQKSMFEVIADPAGMGLTVNAGTQKKLTSFAALIQSFQEAIDTKDAYEVADMVLHQSGIMSAAAMDRTPEGIDRKQNLDELLTGIHEFVQQRIDEGIDFTPIQDFLAEISLLTDQDENLSDTTERVTLMTIHAAKGLEFGQVYIVGMEENLFPSQFCMSESDLEEERRLLYVAITRAMDKCYMSFARQRFKNGAVNFSSPSRFLKDIDRQYLQVSNATGGSTVSSNPRPQWQNSSWETRSGNGMRTGFGTTPATPSPTVSSMTPRTNTAKPAGSFSKVTGQQSAESSLYAAGDRVQHRVFGEGTVSRVYNENDNDKIDIIFDTQGKKTLLLTFAKLQKC